MKFSELEKLGMPLLIKGVRELGFKKMKSGESPYIKRMTENAEYFIGFGTGKPFPGHCMINPVVGVTQKGIATLFEEITGVKDNDAGHALCGRPFGQNCLPCRTEARVVE